MRRRLALLAVTAIAAVGALASTASAMESGEDGPVWSCQSWQVGNVSYPDNRYMCLWTGQGQSGFTWVAIY